MRSWLGRALSEPCLQLHSGPLGSETRLPGDRPGANCLEGAGRAAKSKLFALCGLPGAQGPFLVNILDRRPKNSSTFPQALERGPGTSEWEQVVPSGSQLAGPCKAGPSLQRAPHKVQDGPHSAGYGAQT